MRREVSWPAVLVVVAAVAVTLASAYLLASWPPPPPASDVRMPAAGAVDDRDPAGSPTADDTTPKEESLLLVVGDSFSGGYDEAPDEVWPHLLGDSLGWEVVNDAVPGSGYLNPGRGAPFGARIDDAVAAEPDVVILAGGLNDLRDPVEEAAEAADDLVTRLAAALPDAVIVVVSPFSDGDPGPLTTALAEELEQIAGKHGVEYVDATRFLPTSAGDGIYGPDGFHPNGKGHRLLAEEMEGALEKLDVPRG